MMASSLPYAVLCQPYKKTPDTDGNNNDDELPSLESRAAPSGSEDSGCSEDSNSDDSASSDDSDSTDDSKEENSDEVPDDERASDREATSPDPTSINSDATMHDLDSPTDTRLNSWSDKVSFNLTVNSSIPLVATNQCKQPPTYSQAAATIPEPAATVIPKTHLISKTSPPPTQIRYKLKITIPPNTADSTK
jgi:hypothetical protein